MGNAETLAKVGQLTERVRTVNYVMTSWPVTACIVPPSAYVSTPYPSCRPVVHVPSYVAPVVELCRTP